MEIWTFATDSVMYGPSTQNKIERWWRELLERMERYFKQQLNGLIEDGQYDRDDASHRLAVQLIATSIPISSSYSLHY
jgi:hypothetical protein